MTQKMPKDTAWCKQFTPLHYVIYYLTSGLYYTFFSKIKLRIELILIPRSWSGAIRVFIGVLKAIHKNQQQGHSSV